MKSRLRLLGAAFWLVAVGLIVLSAARMDAVFDSSIMSVLPKSSQEPLVEKAIQQMSARFSKRLLILLSGKNDTEVKNAIVHFANEAEQLTDVSAVRWKINQNELTQLHTELFPFRFVLLDETLRTQLRLGHFQKIKDQALARLFSPVAAGKAELVRDPFALHATLTQNQTHDINVQVADSLLKVTGTDTPTYLMILTLAEEPFSPKVQDPILSFIATQKERLKAQGIQIDMSGMLLHAAAGAQQASKEISSIGVGSLLGIIFIMLLVFRRFKPLGLMLFPIIIGCASATAITILVFERIHLITLAFGAGLVGVSIDYALHYVCERQVTPANNVLKKILPGLLLGLFSSATAYAAQALAPFPGLQQMAVFSVVGLTASWLTVVLWFPLLTLRDKVSPLSAASTLYQIRGWIPSLRQKPILKWLLLILGLLCIYIINTGAKLDDVRLLQTSPLSLMAQEKVVQNKLGTSSSTQFLLIKGQSLEICLQKEEALIVELSGLHTQGLLPDYQGLSKQLPSLKRQQTNSELVQQLYSQQLDGFYQQIKLAKDARQHAHQTLQQDQSNWLLLEDWLQFEGSDAWRDLLVSQEKGSSAVIMRFSRTLSGDEKARLTTLINDRPDLILVDQVQNISDLMKNYRHHISQLLLAAYLVVFVVLFWRYKSQVWRVVLPPILASLYTLAALILIEQGMNLFHLMALILVLGIGLDMGVFMAEANNESHTWLAVSLSSLTSLLAFGLLALSTTPVLHHFGLAVLIGLLLVWLITPMMRMDITEKKRTSPAKAQI